MKFQSGIAKWHDHCVTKCRHRAMLLHMCEHAKAEVNEKQMTPIKEFTVQHMLQYLPMLA